MKIDGINKPIRSQRTKKSEKARAAGSAKSMSPMGETDTVEVADHSQTLDLIRSLVSEAPDVRVDEVDRIVRQLKGGKYKINFEKVAEGFIKEAVLTEMARKSRTGSRGK